MNRDGEKRTGNRKKSRKEQKGEQDREQKRTKQNKKVTSQKLGYQDFWRIANSVLNKGKTVVFCI